MGNAINATNELWDCAKSLDANDDYFDYVHALLNMASYGYMHTDEFDDALTTEALRVKTHILNNYEEKEVEEVTTVKRKLLVRKCLD